MFVFIFVKTSAAHQIDNKHADICYVFVWNPRPPPSKKSYKFDLIIDSPRQPLAKQYLFSLNLDSHFGTG